MAVMSTTNYHNTATDIEDTLGSVPGLLEAVPEDALIHEWPIFKQYTLSESVIPLKYREMMQLAAAAAQRRLSSVTFHQVATQLGATEDKLAEVDVLASLTTRWSAILHSQHNNYNTLEDEVHQIGAFLQEQQSND